MNEQKMCDPENEPRYQLCKVCGAKDCDCTIKDLRNFQAGAASRDAEIQRLQFALADSESLELGTAERCDQLRAQINMLREALEYCVTQVGELATVPGIASALASTPKQPLAEYRNKVIEDCSITIENCEPDEHGRLSIQEIAEAVSAMKEQP